MQQLTDLPRYRFILGSLIFLIRYYAGLVILVPALYIKDIMQDLAISREAVGFLIAITMAAALIFILLAGFIVEKIGSKITASISVALTCMGLYLTGFSPNYGTALIGRFLIGVGISWFIPATSPVLMTWFSSREYGTLMALMVQSISLGLMTHFFLTPTFFPPPNWRGPHVAYATICLILMILWFVLGRGPRGELKKETPYLARLKSFVPKVIKIKEVWLMCIFIFFGMGCGTAFSSWLPEFCEAERGFPIILTSTALGFYEVVNIIAGIVSGRLSDSIGLRRPFVILTALIFPFYVGLMSTYSPIWFYVFVVGMAVFAAIATFATHTIPMEVPEMTYEMIPFAMSVIIFFAFLGQVIMVPLTGYLMSIISPYNAFLLNGILYSLSGMVGFLCRETGWKYGSGG